MAKVKPLTKGEKRTIVELRNKGKKATEIQSESFPARDYYEILKVVRADGKTTALGTIRKISNRCKQSKGRIGAELRVKRAEEIDVLAHDLYEMLKKAGEQLDEVTELHRKMRKILD